MKLRRSAITPGTVIASDATLHMECKSLSAGASAGIRRFPGSDAALLFLKGKGELRVADRIHRFESIRHAHVSAGAAFELVNAGAEPLEYVETICAPGQAETVTSHDAKAGPGGATLLSIEQYDRFPDSGLIRGGMFFLEPGKIASYHSHDAAAEVFIFLRSSCDARVQGVTERFEPGEALYVPAEEKHSLENVGDERLVVWLTVTPNVTPTHTFYEELPGGKWKRVTPRLDGRESWPPSE